MRCRLIPLLLCGFMLQAVTADAKAPLPTFKVSRDAFSTYGAFMSLYSTVDRAGNERLFVSDLASDQWWGLKDAVRVEPLWEGKPLAVRYVGSPAELTGRTERGEVGAAFESPRMLHLRAKDQQLRLTPCHKGEAFTVAEGACGRWLLEKRRMAVALRKGSAELNEGILTLTGDAAGEVEVILEHYERQPSFDARKSYAESVEGSEASYRAFLDGMPKVAPKYEPGRQLAAYINWSCVYEPRGLFKRRVLAVSKRTMTHIWSWDHCFSAMSLAYGLPDLAWDQFVFPYDHQNPETGVLPDVVGAYCGYIWTWTKPPVHGWTLAKMRKHMQLSRAQLEYAYDHIGKQMLSWLNTRDSDRNGLAEYSHGNDSGWDNTTLFDGILPVESPDLAAYLVLGMEEMAKLAQELGKPQEAEQWTARSKAMLKALLDNLWDGERFFARQVKTGAQNKRSQSLMRFIPLILGERLPQDIRDRLIPQLKREGEWLVVCGVASENAKSPLYRADGYWRGPVWAPSTMIIVDALDACGEKALAKEIARRFCDNCLTSGFAENFEATTGRPLRDPTLTWTSGTFLVLAHDYLTEGAED